MTTIFVCYRGSFGGRSIELSQAYAGKGYDVTYFKDGAERMASLTKEQLAHEITKQDNVVFIVDD